MCQYIKDNGEQCGRTAEPFCHDHDDTAQAKLWGRQDEQMEKIEELMETYEEMEEIVKMAEEAETALSDDFDTIVMDATCDECEASLRRSARLTEHPNQPRRMTVEELVECDCKTVVIDARSRRKTDMPSGWL